MTMITGSNCTENQVKDALYQESELVKSIEPDIDINVCKGMNYVQKNTEKNGLVTKKRRILLHSNNNVLASVVK